MKALRGKKPRPHELFIAEVVKSESELNLAHAALLIAKSEYPALDIETYLQRLDQIAETISRRDNLRAAQTASDNQLNNQPDDQSNNQSNNQSGNLSASEALLNSINEYLYQELSFRGNTANYYDPKNSFLNEVLDRRIGIPITLSVIYLEVARRLGLDVDGVGMPGHFLIKCRFDDQEILLDAFNGGRRLSREDCEQMIANIYGEGVPWQAAFLRVVGKHEILTRMLSNLKNIYISGGDNARALSIIERILIVNPDSLIELKERGLINFRLDRFSDALNDLERYLAKTPEGPEAESVRQYLVRIKTRLASLN